MDSTWTSNWTQTAPQTRDICMVFSVNMSHRHGHRLLLLPLHGWPLTQTWSSADHGLGFLHGSRWQGRLLTSGCSSPPPCLQLQLSSQCSNCPASLSLPSVQHRLAHCCNGSCCRQAMRLVHSGYPPPPTLQGRMHKQIFNNQCRVIYQTHGFKRTPTPKEPY